MRGYVRAVAAKMFKTRRINFAPLPLRSGFQTKYQGQLNALFIGMKVESNGDNHIKDQK